MNRHIVPLGKILGIRIGLDYSWFLIFILLTWMLAANYFPSEFQGWPPLLYWLTGGATAAMLFVSVLLHELGHSIVALRYGIPVRDITLFIFGGVAHIDAEPPSPLSEFLIAVAGPVVSLFLAVSFFLAEGAVAGIEPVVGLVKYLAYINFALVLFNLIPGFPLDGGRVFRAIVWSVTKNLRRATLTAAGGGRFFGFLFILLGVWQIFSGNLGGGLWIAFIGWFLESAAASQVQQVVFQSALVGRKVSQAMGAPCTSVPEYLTLQQLVDNHVLASGRRCFLVSRDGSAVGLMTLHRIKEIPRLDWADTTAAQVMIPLEELKQINPDTELWTALRLMDRDGVNQLPVVTGNQVVGMLSRDDVISFLSTIRELGA
jgi:Zn-dependent protease/CBS domain-containing protein